jgi:hypothetical protein
MVVMRRSATVVEGAASAGLRLVASEASAVPHDEQNRPLAAAPQPGHVIESGVPQDEQKRASAALTAEHDGHGGSPAVTTRTLIARIVPRRCFDKDRRYRRYLSPGRITA